MRKADVEIGRVYEAKVSGRLVPVQLLGTSALGGYRALNKHTGREIHVKTAARLRKELA